MILTQSIQLIHNNKGITSSPLTPYLSDSLNRVQDITIHQSSSRVQYRRGSGQRRVGYDEKLQTTKYRGRRDRTYTPVPNTTYTLTQSWVN